MCKFYIIVPHQFEICWLQAGPNRWETVTWNWNYLHSVPKWPWQRVQRVGRSNKQHLHSFKEEIDLYVLQDFVFTSKLLLTNVLTSPSSSVFIIIWYVAYPSTIKCQTLEVVARKLKISEIGMKKSRELFDLLCIKCYNEEIGVELIDHESI